MKHDPSDCLKTVIRLMKKFSQNPNHEPEMVVKLIDAIGTLEALEDVFTQALAMAREIQKGERTEID